MKARDLGIPFDGQPGEFNEITDVQGVRVGNETLIKGEGKLEVGKGPIRTGITVIFPCKEIKNVVYASYYAFNGNGEMTGTIWLDEAGQLKGPICITNTHSVGVVRDAIVEWFYQNCLFENQFSFHLPIVTETYDGVLNDINGFHIKKEHVFSAIEKASTGNVMEGNIGGGTGSVCHQFKGGIGTSSRIIETTKGNNYTLGVLVQANYGLREHLTIAGVPVGKEMKDEQRPVINQENESTKSDEESGSIIIIIATDAPLLPYQLKRIAQRATAGLARVGGYGGNTSGDIFLAFSTANCFNTSIKSAEVHSIKSLNDNLITPLFKATAEATEEAIINALVNAETMTGINNNTIYSIPHEMLIEVMKEYNRIQR